jgi:serine/threonine protein kinase
VRRLGAGGSGEVWVGRHVQTDGVGAVKLLRARRGRERLRALFAREASVIARLQHPHIVSLFELGPEHIVTAFIDGSDLSRRMRGGIDTAHAQRIAVQIGSALASAHAQGVVHHDVKPANILIDRNDNAFLGDFGLASLADEPSSQSLRGGTPGFMAPEQARGEPTGPSADQFSLGRTIIEILAGGTDHADVETALALLPPAAAPLEPALRRGTANDPAARFPSMDAFVAAIGDVVLLNVPPAVRLAPERRSTGPFAWAGAAARSVEVAPAIMRADFKLSMLEAAGTLPAAAVAKFRAATGYTELAWSLYARSDRLGPLSPSLPARTSEIIVLCHGWMASREVWHNLAVALSRDNADVMVLVPDVNGFGDSRLDAPTPEQLAPPSLSRMLMAWLGLIGLGDLPGVVVGHSMSGLGMITADRATMGDRLARIALTPAIFPLAPKVRFAWRVIALLIGWSARLGWLRRLLGWLMVQPNEVTPGLSREQRAAAGREFKRANPRQLAQIANGMIDAQLAPDSLHGVELVYGSRDPVLPRPVAERAVEVLGGSRDRAHLMASGGHVPHMWIDGDPEGSQRNLNELVAIIGAVLLSASEAVATSTLAITRTI